MKQNVEIQPTDPENRFVVHYKRTSCVLINADYDKLGIDDYSIRFE